MIALPDRLARRIARSEDGCWLWNGTISHDGYALAWWKGKNRRIHRVAYELMVGPIPEGLTLDHKCRTRRCVNPKCLEPVTNRENLLRGYGACAQNARKDRCSRGHEFTPDNIYRCAKYPNRRECRECRSFSGAARRARRHPDAAQGGGG